MNTEAEPAASMPDAWQSEELFRQLVKGAKDYAIFMLDLKGSVVSWNTGAELIAGYSEAEIVGKNLAVFYTDDQIICGKHNDDLAIAMNDGRIEDEGWRKRKDGSLFWGNVVLTLIQDEQGEARGFSMVTKDITERKKAETQLLESEARMGAILAAAVDAIIIIDERGTIESLNKAAERLFGHESAEMVGQNVKMLMPPPYRAEHDGYLSNYTTTGVKKIIGSGREVVGLHKNGGTFPMDLAVSEVQVGGRRVFTGIVRDISERKRAEELLVESDARTRAILAAAVDAIITIDEHGTIESLNGAAERLFNYTSADMVNQNVKMLMPSPYRGEHDGYLKNYITTGVKKIIGSGREVVGLRSNGETFPMDLAVSEVQMGGRRLFTGIVRDISERKTAEAQLLESEARTRAILAAAVDAIIIIDERGTIESLNGAAELLFGYESTEMVGQNVKMLMPAPYRNEHDDYLRNYNTTGVKKIIGSGREVVGLRKNGGTFPMDLAVSEVQVGGRRVFTGIVRDITERKSAEAQLLANAAELRQRNEELLRSNQELDAFAYIASHDLKEPLRGIHNYASFLIDDYHDKLDDDGKDKLDTLKRLSQRLDGLLDSLLEISRLGRVDFLPKDVDLDIVLHDIVDSLQITLTERGVSLRIPDQLPHVRGDAVLLGEVLRNLITNSMKYNEKAERWIEVGSMLDPRPPTDSRCELPKKSIAIYVKDNGIGIPEKHHEAVFRIFKRLHSRDAYGGGTGVGLAIAKKVVERHGGEIWIESMDGEGTTIFFTLPGLAKTP